MQTQDGHGLATNGSGLVVTTHWLQLHLTVDRTQAPLIELLFEDLGAVAVTLGDAGDEPMLEPAPGETPLWQATRVTGLFEGAQDADDLRSRIEQSLATDIGRHVTIERLAERDWERAWLERFRPMRFGRRLWVRPSGFDVEQPDAVIVDLDPGLAFGTGTHPTTALCLRWLDGATPLGKRVIDYGCGSGILGIAALKLGAERAVGIDHDPQALLATRSNAERNDVGDRIDVIGNDEYGGEAVGLVIANILANVLIELAGAIGSLVAPGGRLVLSGILADQSDAVVRAYADRFDFADPLNEDGWVLLVAQRRDAD